MAMPLRSLQWRAALSIVGALLVLAWVFASGRGGYVVQIDYNWAREFLDSAVVEIDGDSIGILQRYGRSQFITGFDVEPGTHMVRVLKEGCESPADTVEVSAQGSRIAILMADVDDGFRCRVVLR